MLSSGIKLLPYLNLTQAERLLPRTSNLAARKRTPRHKALRISKFFRPNSPQTLPQVASLWLCLADYFIRLGHFSKARQIFDEAINSVSTVHDFSLLFEQYQAFLTDLVEICDDDDEVQLDLQVALAADLIEQRPLLVNSVLLRQNPHVVFEWLKRAEIMKEKMNSGIEGSTDASISLIDKDHDESQKEDIVDATFREAVKKVDPFKAVGRTQDLWVEWAKHREQCECSLDPENKLAGLRKVYTIATREGRFAHADEIAGIWCEWIETELVYGNYQYALHLARQSLSATPAGSGLGNPESTFTPASGSTKAVNGAAKSNGKLSADSVTGKQLTTNPVQVQKSGGKINKSASKGAVKQPKKERDPADDARHRALRSKKLWYFALDLEENFGTFETLKATYERMIDLKVATPQTMLNFAALLEEKKFFEESFKVYERGVSLFRQPHCHDLWLLYLVKFMSRHKVTKLERSRDLFEQAIVSCSDSMVMQMRLHILYGKLEERYGLARRALEIYQEGCEKISNLSVPEKKANTGGKEGESDTKANENLKSDHSGLLLLRNSKLNLSQKKVARSHGQRLK